MAATPQSQAIGIANQLISMAQVLNDLYQTVTILNQQWTDDAVANTLNAMGTVAQNADGSLGAADATPNPAHPLNLTTYPTLYRAVSANQIASLLTILQNILTYVNGSAVSATGGVRANLNNVTG
jgi:hypothetical protein